MKLKVRINLEILIISPVTNRLWFVLYVYVISNILYNFVLNMKLHMYIWMPVLFYYCNVIIVIIICKLYWLGRWWYIKYLLISEQCMGKLETIQCIRQVMLRGRWMWGTQCRPLLPYPSSHPPHTHTHTCLGFRLVGNVVHYGCLAYVQLLQNKFRPPLPLYIRNRDM